MAARNPDRMALIYNDAMRNHLADSVVECLESLGVAIDDGFRQRPLIMSAASRDHRSTHNYSLEQFGLSEELIASQFEGVYAVYQFDQPAQPGAGAQ